MVIIFKQKVCEGCLAVCLITLLRQDGYDVSPADEGHILFEGLKLSTDDFALGHLDHICRKFPELDVEMYVHYKRFCAMLQHIKKSKNLIISCQKIDLPFLKRITKPVIVYMDAYTLCRIWKVPQFHIPHFVILSAIDDEYAVIHDPVIGKRLVLKTHELLKSIDELRKRLWWSPKVIQIKGKIKN